MKQLTQREAQALVDAVRAKVYRYCEAQRIAREALEKLQAREDWPTIADMCGLAVDADLGDWSC